ncbi:hypothetical protein BN110_021 [Yersinia phage phiR8-01]|uniref:Uncharacterized protein n=1 Tax=Yersinia phage phiR8-01 TaxID=1206556 RepID=I7K2H5_9CAUD|nr:hypothetical protein HOT05_gp10 [Yersinia phage phiR8-01]CCI88391.2 hypothetical protein BN110_021 [Yersinia phage phiR8-01]
MSEYNKAINARKERQKAIKRARKEKEGMRYTTEGDFTHLASNTMKFRRG